MRYVMKEMRDSETSFYDVKRIIGSSDGKTLSIEISYLSEDDLANDVIYQYLSQLGLSPNPCTEGTHTFLKIIANRDDPIVNMKHILNILKNCHYINPLLVRELSKAFPVSQGTDLNLDNPFGSIFFSHTSPISLRSRDTETLNPNHIPRTRSSNRF